MDESGNVEALVFSLVDVTQTVKIQEEVQQTKTHLTNIVESFTDAFISVDHTWCCTYVNQEAIQRAHLSNHKDALGRSFWDLFPHARNSKFKQEYIGAMETQQSRIFEYLSRTTNKWYEVRIYPYSAGLTIFYADITERKLAELKLKESQERFSKAFDAGSAMKSIVSIEKKCFLAVNQAWLKTLGYAREDVIGKSFLDRAFAGDRATETLRSNLMKKPSQIKNKKIKFRTKNGEIRYCLLFTELVNLNDEECLLSTIIDNTDQRRMELEIARLDRLNLIGEMAGGLGHEIRNPMTTVHGFLQMMSAKKEYQAGKEYFEIMMSELDRANTIISEFLVLSNKEVKAKSCYNISHIIRRLDPLIEATALQKGKNVYFSLSEVPEIYGNEKEIRQVILNLVYNGLDASDTVVVKSYYKDNTVFLDITDHGNGISAEILENLGTPFLTTKENGTGLGLPISFSIVKRYGGLIKVQTGKDGTTFSVQLPAHHKETHLLRAGKI
ncbi:MAG: PAS domain S-box protein [Firmicutes bacterium]|nr:PAS domain S-box protein [Bacillota bacterium]